MQPSKTLQIGILAEITREFGRSLCRGISELARESGTFVPRLISIHDLNRPDRLSTYDGFIARVTDGSIADALIASRRPVVDVYYEKPRAGFAIVKARHSKIGALAANHFLDRHFVNFAFCGYAGGRFSSYCKASFSRALSKNGTFCHCYTPSGRFRENFNVNSLINERLPPAPDANGIWEWLKDLPKPIAVFCPNDLRAWQVFQVCKEHDLDIPRDVALLGIDNDILICGLASSMISSIDPNAEAIGRCAAETLLEIIRNPKIANKPIVRQVDPISVVERTSTETYPIEPTWLSEALLYINKNIADNLTAADIYRHVGLSHTQVDKIFKSKLGHTVQEEIANIRLSRSRQLLATTRLPVNDIAPRCGFSSPQYLIRTFTKRFGVSPAIWRSRHAEI